MDLSSLQNTIISNNIANVNTPGYKKKSVRFQEELEKTVTNSKEQLQLKQARAKHLPRVSNNGFKDMVVTETENTVLRNDGNNLDIDMEMAALAENTLYFNSLAELLSTQLALLRNAISEGRR